MPHGKKAASKTPMDAYVDGCHATWISIGHPAKRGVVAAASYEARAFGVRSAMPSIVAARKCAELLFVPPSFDVYREVSRQVQAIFRDYTHWSNRSLSMKPIW